eukprot:3508155-Amphidinium_carterae.1
MIVIHTNDGTNALCCNVTVSVPIALWACVCERVHATRLPKSLQLGPVTSPSPFKTSSKLGHVIIWKCLQFQHLLSHNVDKRRLRKVRSSAKATQKVACPNMTK